MKRIVHFKRCCCKIVLNSRWCYCPFKNSANVAVWMHPRKSDDLILWWCLHGSHWFQIICLIHIGNIMPVKFYIQVQTVIQRVDASKQNASTTQGLMCRLVVLFSTRLLLMQVELRLLHWGRKAALYFAVFLCIRCADWERFWLLGTCRQLAVAASYQRTSHAKNTLRMTSFCAPTVAPFLQPSALLHLESKVTRRSHASPLQLNAPVGKWQPEVTVVLLSSVLSNSITPVEMPALK